MPSNILITGAAGYIGGSVLADLLASKNGLIERERIVAAVRSEEQAQALSKLGIRVLQLNLADRDAVLESLVRHKISIVVHTASSIDEGLALPLIAALGKQKDTSGEDTYFIHTSGLSAFYEKTGWPAGETKDIDPIFQTEKGLTDSFPLRKTDVDVIEEAKAQGVTSFIVIPSTVYGKGSGEWNKLSVVFLPYVKGSISMKQVYKFPENTKVSWVHIRDLTALYQRIIESIVQNRAIPSGREGYYFALGHSLYWWEVLESLSEALRARGLVTRSDLQVWPSDEAAAESLGVPAGFVQALWNSGENIVAERPYQIGWRPAWDKDQFLEHIDDEIEAVLELGKAKSSLIGSLFQAAKA